MSEYIYERPDGPAKIVRDGWNVRIEWDFKQREKIVRCRDCLSWHRGKCYKHAYTMTINGTEYEEGVFHMDKRDFCSLGEPRDEEDN